MEIEIKPKQILGILLSIIGVLLFMNISALVFYYRVDIGSFKSFSNTTLNLVHLFDFNEEANIPTFYSAVTLLISALLLFSITILHKRSGKSYLPWLCLGAVFLFLTFDEFASLHELTIGVSREAFNASGYFHYAWVIPYSIGLVALGLIYIPFLKNLEKKIRNLFLLSAAIFVAGALGFEMLGGNVVQSHGPTPLFAFFYTVEETLEMVGIAVFIFALLTYIPNSYHLVFKLGNPLSNHKNSQ